MIIGTQVTYEGEPETQGIVVGYEPIGDWCVVDWSFPPQARGTGWHMTHMKAYHLNPLALPKVMM